MDPRDLPGARPDDPYLRWRFDPSIAVDAIADGDHVAWAHVTRNGERWGNAFGDDPERVVALLRALDARAPLDGITCPEAAKPSMPSAWDGPDPGHWSLWTRDARVPLDPGDAVELPLDDPRIRPLLEHSSSAYVFPGHPRMRRWAGVLAGDRLLAVAGHQRDQHGAAHLVSVCTDPEARGRGLAARAMALLIARAEAEDVPCVFLEMYVDNPPAAALYRGLGFAERGRYFSWLIGRGGGPELA